METDLAVEKESTAAVEEKQQKVSNYSIIL
jgi:hypothetical protein